MMGIAMLGMDVVIVVRLKLGISVLGLLVCVEKFWNGVFFLLLRRCSLNVEVILSVFWWFLVRK